jgi:class 3 adenylate cyclase/PAS domain-containing protein
MNAIPASIINLRSVAYLPRRNPKSIEGPTKSSKVISDLLAPNDAKEFLQCIEERNFKGVEALLKSGITFLCRDPTSEDSSVRFNPCNVSFASTHSRIALQLESISVSEQLGSLVKNEGLHQVLEQLPVYIVHKRYFPDNEKKKQLPFTFGNGRFHTLVDEKLNGHSIEGKTDYDIYKSRVAAKFIRDDLYAIKNNTIIETTELSDLGEGNLGLVHVLKVPMLQPDGENWEVRCVFWKISERDQVIQAYQRLLNSLITTVPLVIYRKDLRLRFTWINDRYCERVKLSQTEIIGKTDRDLFESEEANQFEADDRIVIEQKRVLDKEEFNTPTKGEKPSIVRVIKVPIWDNSDKNARNEDRRVIGIQGVYWDVNAPTKGTERHAFRPQTLLNHFALADAKRVFAKRELLDFSRRTLSIVFWDVRGFTQLCEILKLDPELMAEFLTEFYDIADDVVEHHGGLLDNFMGDGVMALFGGLDEATDANIKGNDSDRYRDELHETWAVSAKNAVRCALKMRREFAKLKAKWGKQWDIHGLITEKIDVGLGCAINTGRVLAGRIETKRREIFFTALGSAVNLSARLQSVADSSDILITNPTSLLVHDEFECEASEPQRFKGFKNLVRVFKVLRVREENFEDDH